MKELQAIIKAFEQIEQDGTAALATVIEVQGSTYRRIGARMLTTSTGHRIGSISGGCLEADVCDRAQEVLISGKPAVLQYDTTSDSDIVWGLGMGCKGLVRVLVERLIPEPLNPIAFLAECFRRQQSGVLATVCCIEDETQVQVGNRLILEQDGRVKSNINNSALFTILLEDAGKALSDRRSRLNSYLLPTGKVEVLLEVIQPPVPLMIFGAGHDAIPIVRLAKELGYCVTVVATQPTHVTSEQFLLADAVKVTRPEAHKSIRINDQTVAVVMTHNYLYDLEILKTLLPSPARYIGILGPKQRTEQLLQDLSKQGMQPTATQLQRLHGPVGLDIGADTPEAIALSILAEIQAVLANRSGGFLKNRQAPIHSRIVSC